MPPWPVNNVPVWERTAVYRGLPARRINARYAANALSINKGAEK